VQVTDKELLFQTLKMLIWMPYWVNCVL